MTGRPRNRSDCIRYMQGHRPRKISVELTTDETVSEEEEPLMEWLAGKEHPALALEAMF